MNNIYEAKIQRVKYNSRKILTQRAKVENRY